MNLRYIPRYFSIIRTILHSCYSLYNFISGNNSTIKCCHLLIATIHFRHQRLNVPSSTLRMIPILSLVPVILIKLHLKRNAFYLLETHHYRTIGKYVRKQLFMLLLAEDHSFCHHGIVYC